MTLIQKSTSSVSACRRYLAMDEGEDEVVHDVELYPLGQELVLVGYVGGIVKLWGLRVEMLLD